MEDIRKTKLARTRKIELTGADMTSGEPLRSALERAGYGVESTERDRSRVTRLPGQEPLDEPAAYRHSQELYEMLQAVEAGERTKPFTLLVSDRSRNMACRENGPDWLAATGQGPDIFRVEMPAGYAQALARIALDRGATAAEVLTGAVRRAVIEETLHLPMPGRGENPLCGMGEARVQPGAWENADPDRRCPECALALEEEK
jgi:hypothetical protein